jgi:choline dehydrogenase-like flavoprotein
MLPFSRGNIHIVSRDPMAAPAIEPRVYSSVIDKRIALASVRFLDRLARTPPLAGFLVRRTEPPEGELSDEELWAYAKRTTGTIKHPMGTCAMLPADEGGVVDDALRVYGVRGLRVVDASVFPLHIAAHLQATVHAVAEKAADLILGRDSDEDDE